MGEDGGVFLLWTRSSTTWEWSGVFLLSTVVFTSGEELGPGEIKGLPCTVPSMMVLGYGSMAITMVTVDDLMASFYKVAGALLRQGFGLKNFHVPKQSCMRIRLVFTYVYMMYSNHTSFVPSVFPFPV